MSAHAQRRHQTTYGWRAKLGLIVPPTNTVNEAEWQIMAPEGVSVHTTRMPLHADTSSPEAKQALRQDISRATHDLAQAGVDVIAYGCTAGSMVVPMTEITDYMTEVSGIAAVTTAASIVHALRALGTGRICIATPYHDALNAHEKEFLGAVDIETINIEGLGIGADGDYTPIAKTTPDDIVGHVTKADRAQSQAMLVSCTDFPVLELIPRLEHSLNKPVVTSNQATFWGALRAAGIDTRFDGFGALLRDH